MRRIGAVIAAAFAVSCSSGMSESPAPPAPAVPVATETVRFREMTDMFEVGGIVQARTAAAITARLVAPVHEVRVTAGDRVRAGQILVVLESPDLAATTRAAVAASAAAAGGAAAARAEAQSAQAALVLARASHDRIATLHARRSATAQELDQATAALRAAESRVHAAAARVEEAAAGLDRAEASRGAAAATESFLRLTAPFDGVVTEKLVEPGNMAAPGLPLLRVEDPSGFRVEVRLDESRISGVRPGLAVPVWLEGEAGPVTGSVGEISRAVDADRRTSLVKIALPTPSATPRFRSGAFARVGLPGEVRRALVVPIDAVILNGQVTSVFVAEQGTARLRLVRVRGGEVLAGLTDGEAVIVSPPPGLQDGRAVSFKGAP